MYIFDNYSHEYKTRRIFELRIKSCYKSNVFITGITNECAMSMIENNSATLRVPSSNRAWIESLKHGEDEKSRNMINVHLAHKKSTIDHRSSNVSCPVENVVYAQPSGSHEEDKTQNSKFKF